MPSKNKNTSLVVTRTLKNPNGSFAGSTYQNKKSYVVNKPEWPETLRENPFDFEFMELPASQPPIKNLWNNYYTGPNCSFVSPAAVGDFCLRAESAFSDRLYATCYTKFVEAARQGSAEWGMNIVQGRKTWTMALDLIIKASFAAVTLLRGSKAAVEYLKRHPNSTPKGINKRLRRTGRHLLRAKEKKHRHRLSNELFVLEQTSGLLLAWRYGIYPLMTDIASTTEVLSGEMDDVTLRKAAKAPWSGYRKGAGGSYNNQWSGSESCVLKASVSCTNPNLGLANRLGLVNPQYWLWDATPWSYLVDWWLPIGDFLSNFTSAVGLTFKGASITRSKRASVTLDAVWKGVEGWPANSPSYLGNYGRKQRTVGSLPIPLSVPYGKGLSIQRAQNALALMGSLMGRKIRPNLRKITQ